MVILLLKKTLRVSFRIFSYLFFEMSLLSLILNEKDPNGNVKPMLLVLMAACANEDSDPMVVKEILSRMDRSSVNYRMRSQSIKWRVLRGCAKLMVRVGLLKSMLAHRLAHGAGLTALHYAARRGDVEIVTLLLEAGADPYLENEMGLNSFDITEKFGPFPNVMRVLNKN